jgi:hypothetical protein
MKKREYIYDFFTVVSGYFVVENNDIDLTGYNNVYVVNLTQRPIQVPFPGGVTLGQYQKLQIKGNENEMYYSKLTISFKKVVPLIEGQALIIRKKYI